MEAMSYYGLLKQEITDQDLFRYNDLYWRVLQQMNFKLSVDMVYTFMDSTFITSDLNQQKIQKSKLIVSPQNLSCLNTQHECQEQLFNNFLQIASHPQQANLLTFAQSIQKLLMRLITFQHYITLRYFCYLEVGIISVKQKGMNLLIDVFKICQIGKLKVLILSLLWNFFRQGLSICLAKIAYKNDNLHLQTKKAIFSKFMEAFELESDYHVNELFNSYSETHFIQSFKVRCLGELVRKLGYGRRQTLEKLMKISYPKKTIIQYEIKNQFFNYFQENKGAAINKKTAQFRYGIEFYLKEFDKQNQVNQSDIIVRFLELQKYQSQQLAQKFHPNSWPSPLYQQYDKLLKENVLIKFIRSTEFLIKQQFLDDQYFKRAFIMMIHYVLKQGIDNVDLVEQSIFSMQFILNKLGINLTVPYLKRFQALSVMASLKCSEKYKEKVQQCLEKILQFYLQQKTSMKLTQFNDIQFQNCHTNQK